MLGRELSVGAPPPKKEAGRGTKSLSGEGGNRIEILIRANIAPSQTEGTGGEIGKMREKSKRPHAVGGKKEGGWEARRGEKPSMNNREKRER